MQYGARFIKHDSVKNLRRLYQLINLIKVKNIWPWLNLFWKTRKDFMTTLHQKWGFSQKSCNFNCVHELTECHSNKSFSWNNQPLKYGMDNRCSQLFRSCWRRTSSYFRTNFRFWLLTLRYFLSRTCMCYFWIVSIIPLHNWSAFSCNTFMVTVCHSFCICNDQIRTDIDFTKKCLDISLLIDFLSNFIFDFSKQHIFVGLWTV